MSRTFPESDWTILRDLRKLALERFCERIVGQVAELAGEGEQSWHERYLTIYRYIHDQDKELGLAFNEPRRSQALLQFCRMYSLALITAEELARFSTSTREAVERIRAPE